MAESSIPFFPETATMMYSVALLLAASVVAADVTYTRGEIETCSG